MKVTVFTKIFAYTMLLVLLICVAALFLFASEFFSFYRSEQRRKLGVSFEPIISAMAEVEQSPEEILERARAFANSNQSLEFKIESGDGNIIFVTKNPEYLSEGDPGILLRYMGQLNNMTRIQVGRADDVYVSTSVSGESANTSANVSRENIYVLTGYNSASVLIDYGELARRSFLALLLMLLIAVLGAVLFAKKVTKPLEDEIIRERAMEENQRLFFSAASHELKTPIAAARAIVEGMIAGVGDFNDHPKYLRECLNTLESQTRLVSEILEIVKLSGEETEPSLHSFDLADLGNAVLAEYRPLAEIKDLAIHGEFPHVTVRCDRALLQRVLSNVIANAVQYTQEGQTIRITSSNGQKSLRVSILNTGAHISGEAVSRLFEPFYRMDTARTRHGTQSGMGLAIVKKALDRMKLPFALENTEEGVLFWVDLAVEKR
jgi:two-component system sensor histidine kinase VanS